MSNRKSIEASNDPTNQTYERSNTQILIDALVQFRWFILVILGIAVGVGWYMGYSIPTPTFWQIYVALLSVLGIIGGAAIWSRIKYYIGKDTVLVDIVPFGVDVKDRIVVPRETWLEMDIVGGQVPTGSTLSGKRVYAVRAIDFDRGEAFPADDFPEEDEVPNFWDIRAVGAEQDDKKYRDYLLEKAKKYSQLVVDDEVIREDARGDAVMLYAKGLQDGREGDIDVERKPDQETILEAQQVVQQMQGQGKDGGDDE